MNGNDDVTTAAAAAAAPVADEAFKVADEQAAEAEPKTAADVVTEWFNECIHNSEVSRMTPAYNAVQLAVEELKKRLDGFSK